MAVHKIEPATRNPKGHALDELRESMTRWGFIEPIVMDERTGRLIAGHGRTETLAAAELAGLEPPEGIVVKGRRWHVPVVRGWSSVDDDEAAAALVAVNHLTEAGGWNVPELTSMLDELRAGPGLAGTGYTGVDLDAMLASLAAPPVQTPEPPAPGRKPKAHTKRGDVWQLGRHRLLCGDARDPADVAKVLDGRRINIGVTSPPYAEQREYDGSSGFVPIPPDEYVDWFAPVAANVRDNLADDGSWFINIKPAADGLDTELYVLDLVLAHAREWGWHFATEFCWERNGVPKSVHARFKNQFEPVYQFALGKWKIRPDQVRRPSTDALVAFGGGRGNTSWADPESAVVSQGQRGDLFAGQRAPRRTGRGNTSWKDRQGNGGAFPDYDQVANGWAYPGNRLPTFAGTHEAVGHTAAFPVGLPAWFAQAFTDLDDVVFDPFMGSGSTILAAEQTGRIGIGIELSREYCDMICARWFASTGIKPERAGKAYTF